MPLSDLTENVAKVRCKRQITTFVRLIALQARPVAVDVSAANTVANHEHRISVTMIGSAVAVLARSTAELGHCQNDHIVHPLAKVDVQRRDGRTELSQQIAELSLLVPFVDVRVPTANIRECDF